MEGVEKWNSSLQHQGCQIFVGQWTVFNSKSKNNSKNEADVENAELHLSQFWAMLIGKHSWAKNCMTGTTQRSNTWMSSLSCMRDNDACNAHRIFQSPSLSEITCKCNTTKTNAIILAWQWRQPLTIAKKGILCQNTVLPESLLTDETCCTDLLIRRNFLMDPLPTTCGVKLVGSLLVSNNSGTLRDPHGCHGKQTMDLILVKTMKKLVDIPQS